MMRRISAILMTAVFSLTLALAGGNDTRNVELSVAGMHCKKCSDKIESALRKATDVREAKVNLEAGKVVVTLATNSKTTIETLKNAVAEAGYHAYLDGEKVEKVEKAAACSTEGKSSCSTEKKDEAKAGAKTGACCEKKETKKAE